MSNNAVLGDKASARIYGVNWKKRDLDENLEDNPGVKKAVESSIRFNTSISKVLMLQ